MLAPELAAVTAHRLLAYAGSLLAMVGDDAGARNVRQALATIAIDEAGEWNDVDPLLAVALMRVALTMLDRSGYESALTTIYLQQSIELAPDLDLPPSPLTLVASPT